MRIKNTILGTVFLIVSLIESTKMSLTSSRLISLDALRGFTVAAMLMVNFPGSSDHVFFTLRHTVWNGLSFTDLVAPIFLYVIGVSIVLAYATKKDGDKKELYKRIIVRSLKIYAVGMFLNLMPDFNVAEARWTGTLHRIAFVFLGCALLYLNTDWKQQAWAAVCILIGYWLTLTLVPTPSVGKVMLEPGVNIVAWFDSEFLPGKMWQGTWDPESILSTFPSIASGMMGMLAGRLLISQLSPNEKVNYLMTGGVVSSALGYFWGLGFPVNENLWTSSFVLVPAGFASLLLGALYFTVDILGKTKGTKVGIIFGANAISVYVLGDILALFFYGTKLGDKTPNEHAVDALVGIGMNPNLASWLYALFFVAINFIPAYWLYRKKIFIKL